MQFHSTVLLLPTIMLTFAIVFFAMVRPGFRSSLHWAIGLLFGAVGFAVPLAGFPVVAQILVADALFLTEFVFFGNALLMRYHAPLLAPFRITLALVALALDTYIVVGLDSLGAEIVVVNTALGLLLAIPLLKVARHARHLVDKIQIAAGALLALDFLIRPQIALYYQTINQQFGEYQGTSFAAATQFVSVAMGLPVLLAALGSNIVELIAQYRDAAERDPMTGLLNRGGFDQAVAGLTRSGVLSGAVVLGDIDCFKQVNDGFGHATGDMVIAAFADQLREDLPSDAIAARFGGEEFVIFLPRANVSEAALIVEAIRARFAARQWEPLGVSMAITVSFGVAAPADGELTLLAAIARADSALYAAKEAGRNRVVIDQGQSRAGTQRGLILAAAVPSSVSAAS